MASELEKEKVAFTRTINSYNNQCVVIYNSHWSASDRLMNDNLHWQAVLSALKGLLKIIDKTQVRLYRTGKYNEVQKLNTYIGIATFMYDYVKTEIIGNDKRGCGVSDSAEKQALCWKNINNILRQCVLADKVNAGAFGELIEERLGLK